MATKKVTITLSPEDQERARKISKKILGKENISGLFTYWINKHKLSK